LIDHKQILKQYEGFLETPQLFKTPNSLEVEFFETNQRVNINSISDRFEELSRQKYLGKRAELFLLQYLISSEQYSNIIHSFQIQDNEKTIGELDIVCFDNSRQKWIHIELVYKLYVFVGERNYDDFTQWIGPNLKDRLDYKMDKLMSHQLPLGQHQQILNKIETENVESYCCFKAKLFLKSNEQLKSNHLNDECISGYYLNFEDFKLLRHNDFFFYVPEKADWLCDAQKHSKWYGYDKAEALLKQSIKDKRARLAWQKTHSGKIFEYFVVWW
jgi:hypothetical protein